MEKRTCYSKNQFQMRPKGKGVQKADKAKGFEKSEIFVEIIT